MLGALIVIWEVGCPEGELLSEAMDRWIVSHPVMIRVGVVAMAVHLANLVPPNVDPIHHAFVLMKAHNLLRLHQIAARLPKTDCAI